MFSDKAQRLMKIIGVLVIVGAIVWHEAKSEMLGYSPFAGKSAFVTPSAPQKDSNQSSQMSPIDKPATVNYSAMMNDPKAINVKNHGAKGDGRTDDTAAIQAAVNAAQTNAGKVLIPTGTYLVDALQSIRIKSGVTLLMANNAVLKAIPNRSKFYAVLTVEDASNVSVFGGVIQGERDQHMGTEGEWGTGIQINGSKNVTVQGTVVKDCWGDGFYIGTETFTGPGTWEKLFNAPENIRLIDVKADNNRRQGISLISGRNIEIIRAQLTNTKGTDPAAGLDIEPNNAKDVLENISVIDIYTAGNQGAGISVNLSALKGSNIPVSIKVVNHLDDGSERGFMIPNNAIIPGNLLIENPIWKNSKFNGLAILCHDHRSFNITVKQPEVFNANRSGSKVPTTGAAIAVYNFNQLSRRGGIGNVNIFNASITDSEPAVKTVSAFHIWDLPGEEIVNLSIVDPVINGNIALLPMIEQARGYMKHIQRKL